MYTLNLDEGFKHGTMVDFSTGIFPTGEIHTTVGSKTLSGEVRINCRLNDSDSIMKMLMTANALQEAGIVHIDVFAPYFPYATQDRVCSEGESFGLKVMCDMLEASSVSNITT